MKVITTGLKFPEGPISLDNGTVIVTEIEGAGLNLVAPDGSQKRIHCGGGVNGAALGPDGAVYACNDGGLKFKTEDGIRFPYALADDNKGGAVQRVDLATAKVQDVFTHVDRVRIGNLNDIVFDTTGSCYIVDTTRGVLYYANPIGDSIKVVVEGLTFPNGMGLSPDGKQLYVSETYTGNVLAWNVVKPGVLDGKTQIHTTGGEQHWDGLAVDGAGHVCISNLKKSGITVLSPAGEVVREFVTPTYDSYVTNICFGGTKGDTAYICSSGRGILYAMQWPWPGLRLNYAR